MLCIPDSLVPEQDLAKLPAHSEYFVATQKIPMSDYRTRLFKIASLLSLLAAVYHLVGIFYPINSSPAWRHLLFVCVALFCSYGLTKRPKYFVYFFFLLVVQQFYSHGGSLINQWIQYHTIDWISLVLLLFLPVIFFNLILESKSIR